MGPQPLEEKERKKSKFCAAASLFLAAAADSSRGLCSFKLLGYSATQLRATQSATLRLSSNPLKMPVAIGTDGPFVPALIVVDMQEDFCPPVSEE
jgi:hypothetical protein